jgi:TonB family protein
MMVVPPIIRTNFEMPSLPVAPTLLGIAETPVVNYQIGIPLGASGPPSGGPGGLGNGHGPDVGDNPGPGSGIGNKAGVSGPPRGKKVTMPELLTQNEPEYTEEARKAKLQGTVDLTIVVGADGRVERVDVIRSLGLGLDERAVDAVKKWRFRPATSDGKPIAASAAVAVTFRLL